MKYAKRLLALLLCALLLAGCGLSRVMEAPPGETVSAPASESAAPPGSVVPDTGPFSLPTWQPSPPASAPPEQPQPEQTPETEPPVEMPEEPASAEPPPPQPEAPALAGVFLCDKEDYGVAPEYRPTLTLAEDGSFHFYVNLLEGMGSMSGSYAREKDQVICTVTHRDFSGFTGDDITLFTMEILDDDHLTYHGGAVGLTFDGDIFRRA